MKELSIEEKAKRYDEAIERAKNTIEVNQTIPDIVECVESLFPELKESEDERIRKVLIDYFKSYKKQGTCGAETFNGIPTDNIIAWLEKQGEQKSVIEMKTPDESLGIDSDTYNKIVDKCVYGEQKPAWSEEDGKIINGLITICDEVQDNIPRLSVRFSHVEALKNWLKSLKDKVQPKQEWSEEDNAMLISIENILIGRGHSFHDKEIDWLKSIRPQNNSVTDDELEQAKKEAYNDALDKIEYHSGEPTFDDGWSAAIWYLKKKNAQPQSQWKPSDEQIGVIEAVINNRSFQRRHLDSLYADLKKLKS